MVHAGLIFSSSQQVALPHFLFLFLMEKKEHTLVPLAPKQEGYNPFANNGLSLYTETPSPYRIGGCTGIFRKLRMFYMLRRNKLFLITKICS